MRVAIMGRSVRPGASGVGRHAANLVDAIIPEVPPGSLTVFLTQDAPNRWNGSIRQVRAPFPTPNEYARAVWEQTVVPAQVTMLGVHLYHSPNYILPLALPCPSVVTIHDLAYLKPSLHKRTSHYYLSALTSLALKRASAVVAVSDYTRRLVESRYPGTAGRVEVIYQGVDPGIHRPAEGLIASFKAKIGFAEPFVLFVGTLEPRKNLVRLVAAFEQAVRQTCLPHHLVLIGSRGWKTAQLDRALEESPLRDRIHQVGYVPDEDLPYWYACSDLFVYPSLEEGFGLPPLEAMTVGVPVVTSNCSALAEVVGDAALTVDPYDVDGLALAMSRALTQRDLRDYLVASGLDRSRQFSWGQAARRHLDLYQRVLSGGV